MLVSHYIIDSILEVWDEPENVRRQFKKFSERYADDTEFVAICEQYFQSSEKKAKLDGAKQRLKELRNSRQLEGSGGTQMPFKDRRHMGDSQRGR